jgi:hypothetical protein
VVIIGYLDYSTLGCSTINYYMQFVTCYFILGRYILFRIILSYYTLGVNNL